MARPEDYEFYIMLIDEYVKYPVGAVEEAWFPFNYCALPLITTDSRLKGLLNVLISYFC